MTEALLAMALTALGAAGVYVAVKWIQWRRSSEGRFYPAHDEAGFYDGR
jgi:hypothetical protein